MRKAIPLLALVLVLGLIMVQMGCSKKEDPVTPTPCKITMLTPGSFAGEFSYTGQTINIRWDRNTGSKVKIELFKGATFAGTIADEWTNDGFFPWTNSETFSSGSGVDYSIKVTHLSDSDCHDQTNTFEMIDISNCIIEFPWTSQNPIREQLAGDIFNIIWTSENTSGNVDLELWYEPFSSLGEIVGTIAENRPNTGSFLWTVDSFNRGTDEGYRFKIKDSTPGAAGCNDESITFMITDEDNCSINVLGVGDGAFYDPGQTIHLSFDLENSSGVVKLELFSGAEPVAGGLITSSFNTQNGTAFYNWVVDDFGHPGPSFARYNIVATDVNDEYCKSKNGSKFTITR
jgi:hypothetical protein